MSTRPKIADLYGKTKIIKNGIVSLSLSHSPFLFLFRSFGPALWEWCQGGDDCFYFRIFRLLLLFLLLFYFACLTIGTRRSASVYA